MNILKEIKKVLGYSSIELTILLDCESNQQIDQWVRGFRNPSFKFWLGAYAQFTPESRRAVLYELMEGIKPTEVLTATTNKINADLLAIAVFRKLTAARKGLWHARTEFCKEFGINVPTVQSYDLHCPTQAQMKKVTRYFKCWKTDYIYNVLETVIKEHSK